MRKKLAGTMLLSGVLLLGSAGCETVGGMTTGFGYTEPTADRSAGEATPRTSYRRSSERQAELERIIADRDRLAEENAALRAEIARLQSQ
ncbi:MAG: hypothetical protein AAF750_11855 [Planctomycetota bacterium]